MNRIILGGILGALVLFGWSAIAHMPPLGTAGLRMLPPAPEDSVIAALRGAMHERAIYILPGIDPTRSQTPEEQQAWMVKFEAGPAAVVAYNPHPAERAHIGSAFATWFAIEFAGDIFVALLAALIASSFSRSLGYWPRVLLVAALGLIGTVDIDLSYWNWYAFPTPYFVAQLADHVGGWFLAGLVLARVCRPA